MHRETKLASYSNTPFTKICAGMRVVNEEQLEKINWIGIQQNANSLHSLIAGKSFKGVHVNRGRWQSLINDASLPEKCEVKGFNVHGQINQNEMRVRLGYLAHRSCTKQEALIGFGTNLDGYVWSSGYVYPSRNEANKHIPAFGYIFVR